LIFSPDFYLSLAGIADLIYFPSAFIPAGAGAKANIFSDFFHVSVSGEGILVVTLLGHLITSVFSMPRQEKTNFLLRGIGFFTYGNINFL